MNISNYKEAQKYAYAITTSEYLDILHDAYLHWNKYKQSDLFDQDKEFTYQKDGVRYNREFVDVKPTNLIENKIEDNLHVDQAIDLLNKHLTPNQKLTFFYSLLGYKRKDIAKELNVREATIVDRFKLIQEKYRKLAL
jgi:DNA-directed RNA polymerase specialized sigma24 family protein